NEIFSGSLFNTKKIITINNATDKIYSLIEELIEKKVQDVKLILIAGVLEKRSKLRNIFEKNKLLISVAFYSDDNQILSNIANEFFKSKKISISFETINALVNKCNGERKFLNNELEKIEMFLKNRTSISIKEINKLTNLGENHSISELVDNCLAKNIKKINYLMNENNFGSEDSVLIIRTLLLKSKRLLNLIQNFSSLKNIDITISNAKPPIFWKDKDIVKKQIKAWSLNQVEKLIFEINDIELLIKTNSQNSANILSDFIISKSR
ncbi:DNA polymerase III subunit delta, partial [Candidatus Pelagibacter sp.]|uniref:DNA polymerase III subunit delta n=1 Tax=Candidatus Pelagibacter sp. TaxID=2024849 RepID=UPI003F85DD26